MNIQETFKIYRIIPLVACATVCICYSGCDISHPDDSGARAVKSDAAPHVLLITIDTLRADRVGYISGAEKSKTPHIDAWAKEGVKFTHARTPVPLTLSAHASILSGLHPLQHGVHNNVPTRVPESLDMLPEILQINGYKTIAAVSAEVLSEGTGIAQGFEVFHDPYQLYGSEKAGGEIAEKTIRAVKKILNESSRDTTVFVWVHLYDPHDPYTPPAGFQKDSDSLYDAEVRYTDVWVSKLLAYWEEFCAGRKNMTIIASDHGEGLSEHGEKYHGYYLYETTLHVPLIIKATGIAPDMRDDTVCLYDIFPTILSYCGYDVPNTEILPAIDILSYDERSVPIVSETRYPETLGMNISRGYAVRKGDKKVILQPMPWLYDLADKPIEENIVENSAIVEAISNEIYTVVHALQRTEIATTKMSDDTIDMVTSLGYVGGGSIDTKTATGEKELPVFPHPDWRAPMQETGMIARIAMFFRLPDTSDEKLKMMMESYKLEPENQYVIKGLASLFCRRSEYQRAVELCDKIDREDVWRGKMWYDMTLAYAKTRRKDDALECAKYAVVRCPDDNLSYQAMALAYLSRGEFAVAESNAHKAVQLAPRNKSAWNNFGLIQNVLQNHTEAQKAFGHAMALTQTNDQKSVMKYGRASFFAEDLDDAQWAFEKALELNPNNDTARGYLRRIAKKVEEENIQ